MSDQPNTALCESCKNRDFDLSQGIVCSLTNTKRLIGNDCPDYLCDVKRAEEIKRKEKSTSNPSRLDHLLSVTAIIPATILLPFFFVFIADNHPLLFASVFGVLGYVGLIASFFEQETYKYLKAFFHLSGMISFFLFLLTHGRVLFMLEDFYPMIILWPAMVTTYKFIRILSSILIQKPADDIDF